MVFFLYLRYLTSESFSYGLDFIFDFLVRIPDLLAANGMTGVFESLIVGIDNVVEQKVILWDVHLGINDGFRVN